MEHDEEALREVDQEDQVYDEEAVQALGDDFVDRSAQRVKRIQQLGNSTWKIEHFLIIYFTKKCIPVSTITQKRNPGKAGQRFPNIRIRTFFKVSHIYHF